MGRVHRNIGCKPCNVKKTTVVSSLQLVDIVLHGKILMMVSIDSLSAMPLLLSACHAKTDHHRISQTDC